MIVRGVDIKYLETPREYILFIFKIQEFQRFKTINYQSFKSLIKMRIFSKALYFAKVANHTFKSAKDVTNF